ncbi:hypothetical protein [Pseudomonas sp. NA-150]|uniref:hypothetical protein n=1 Tax=Pseudomonas sp. NA-150 TaxID=3367525 RepID=UPI0037CB9010
MKAPVSVLLCVALLAVGTNIEFASAAEGPPSSAFPPAVAMEDGNFLLTIFLRHDQSKPLSEINRELTEQEFFKRFPPEGIEVVSWYVMMGIGQVVTLKVPAARLREVNRVIEDTAWGGFKTEFYPTYDYTPMAKTMHSEALGK